MRRWVVAALVVVVLGAVVWGSLRGGSGDGTAVEVEKVGRRTIVAAVKATGEINPKRKVAIQSKVIGEITAVPVKEGESVRAGEIVLEIEKQQYLAVRDQASAALNQAKVNLERAKAELANAELELKRAVDLESQGVSSQQSVDQARLARDTAEVGVRAQEQAIKQAQSSYQRALDDLDRTTIRSPMDGTVTALNVEKGETAVMGTMNFMGSVLMEIADLSEMVAEVDVAESEVVSIKIGQTATVTVDALPDTPLAGHVAEIASSGTKDGDVVKFKVKVSLDAPDPRIRPAMTAKVEITTATSQDALAVPQQAVQTRWVDSDDHEVERREGDESQKEVSVVYTVRDGTAHKQAVKTGIHDELWVEVKDGLTEGEDVVVGPYRTLRDLKDGDKVRIEKTSADKR